MITALDHIALAVENLDAAVAGYQALLGRAPNWVGGDGGARHAWFQLGNMALDVIAPHGEGAFGDLMRRRLAEHGEGIWGMAYAVADAEAAHKLATRRGLAPTPFGPIRSTHDDGRKRYWSTCSLAHEATAGVHTMLVAPPRDGQPWPVSPPTGGEAACVSGLDHVVVATPNPDRAQAIYGARLGLDMRLDRSNPDWGTRLMFFRCGDAVVEIAHSLKGAADPAGEDGFYGVTWRVPDLTAARERMAAAGFDVSEIRTGRRRGTEVFTVRDAPAAIPTLVICVENAGEI